MSPRRTRGMTLVELMVGLAIGLFIVATALGLVAHQLQDDRTLLQESRLRVSLQSAADAVARDLRRAGYRGDAGIAIAREGVTGVANPYAGIDLATPAAAVLLSFALTVPATPNAAVPGNEEFGFQLKDGVVRMMLGQGNWQPVTDPAALVVTRFTITPELRDLPLGSFCEHPCPVTDASCPRQQVRLYDVTLAARSPSDAGIVRELTTSVRTRNDVVTGVCPA